MGPAGGVMINELDAVDCSLSPGPGDGKIMLGAGMCMPKNPRRRREEKGLLHGQPHWWVISYFSFLCLSPLSAHALWWKPKQTQNIIKELINILSFLMEYRLEVVSGLSKNKNAIFFIFISNIYGNRIYYYSIHLANN